MASTMAERFAISEIVARYSYTWDAKDADGFAELFTNDGTFELYLPGASEPHEREQGRAVIRASALEAHTGRLNGVQTRHFQTQLIFLELTPASATTQNMLFVTHQRDAADPKIACTGVYRDKWKKTPHGWRFAQRRLYLDNRASM